MHSFKFAIVTSMALFSTLSTTARAQQELDLRFAGALEFSDQGVLFVGDNHRGAIYAFDTGSGSGSGVTPSEVVPVSVRDIDVRIADVLGVGPRAVEINDMAVHPKSQEIFISVSRLGGQALDPAVIKVTQDGGIEILDLASLPFAKQDLAHYPDQETTFKVRGLMGQPPTAMDQATALRKLSSLAIMDMVFHEGGLFVSGVGYEDFLSTLRRIPYPFDGQQAMASVEMYHISHDQYETRAPIRAMSIQEIDGKDQLIAAYTCSPVVLIPLDQIVDGAKIAASTVGSMGNGQPIDMVAYTFNGQKLLFVSSNSRSPQVMPVDGFNGTKVLTEKDFEPGPKMDLSPGMPSGPMGKVVMFDGSTLHTALLGSGFLVSIARDAPTGSLNLDSNLSFFPNRLHNLQAEYDFPQYQPKSEQPAAEDK